MRTVFAIGAACILLCGCGSLIDRNMTPSREYHVSESGDDNPDGTTASPFRAISPLAEKARPGDVVTVHEGVYRERFNPPRGGGLIR